MKILNTKFIAAAINFVLSIFIKVSSHPQKFH